MKEGDLISYKYEVVMETTIGDKKGELDFEVQKENVYGDLEILGQQSVIKGKVNEKGRLNISGSITTPVRTIVFEATGSFDKDKIRLKLKTEREVLDVYGKACV